MESRWLNGVTVLATRAQLAGIEALPFVAEVTDLNPHVPKEARKGRVPADPDLRGALGPGSDQPYGWSGPQVRQLQLHIFHEAGFNGSNVRVAVIDTGFLLSHSAFNDPEDPLRVMAEWDFVDNDPLRSPEAGDYPDQQEHGTLVLGTIAANRPGEMVGSAPDADLILLKAEDAATEYSLEEK